MCRLHCCVAATCCAMFKRKRGVGLEADLASDQVGLEDLSQTDAGPQELSHLWWWPNVAVEKLSKFGLLDNVVYKLGMGINLSTAYSGLGAGETVFAFLREAVGRATNWLDFGPLCVQSASSLPYV